MGHFALRRCIGLDVDGIDLDGKDRRATVFPRSLAVHESMRVFFTCSVSSTNSFCEL